MQKVNGGQNLYQFTVGGQTSIKVPLGQPVEIKVSGWTEDLEAQGIKIGPSPFGATLAVVALGNGMFGLIVFNPKGVPVPAPSGASIVVLPKTYTYVLTEAEIAAKGVTIKTSPAPRPGPATPQEIEDLQALLEGIKVGTVPAEELNWVLEALATATSQARDDVIT